MNVLASSAAGCSVAVCRASAQSERWTVGQSGLAVLHFELEVGEPGLVEVPAECFGGALSRPAVSQWTGSAARIGDICVTSPCSRPRVRS